MATFETRLFSNDPRYRASKGAVAIYVFPTEKAARDKAREVNDGWRDQPFPMTATVHDATFDMVCTIERPAFADGIRVYLRVPSTVSQRSAMARMAHAARKDMGCRVVRITSGAEITEKGLVTTWTAYYLPRREN